MKKNISLVILVLLSLGVFTAVQAQNKGKGNKGKNKNKAKTDQVAKDTTATAPVKQQVTAPTPAPSDDNLLDSNHILLDTLIADTTLSNDYTLENSRPALWMVFTNKPCLKAPSRLHFLKSIRITSNSTSVSGETLILLTL